MPWGQALDTRLLSEAGFPVLQGPPKIFKGGMGKLDINFLEQIRAFLSNIKNFSQRRRAWTSSYFSNVLVLDIRWRGLQVFV